MNYVYRIGFALLLAGAMVTSLTAQENVTSFGTDTEFSKVGVGTGTSLTLPVGARATAMGAAFSGLADDQSALFWNPAGIAAIPGASASYSYGALFTGVVHSFAGVSFPVGESYKAGIGAISYGTDDIEVTTMFDQDGTGETYTAQDLSFGVTFAGQLTDQFAFGVTGKLVNLSIASASAQGIAFDVGTLYDPGFMGMKIGFVVQNLGTPLTYTGTSLSDKGTVDQVTGNRNPDVQLETNSASLPLTFRAGLSSDILRDEEMHDLIANAEFSTSSDAPERLGLGAEYVWNDLLAARAGYQFGSPDAFGITAGLGVKYDSGPLYATLDYAIRPHETLGLVNMFTASVRFQ